MSELKIAHVLNDHHAAMFTHLLGQNFHAMNERPGYGCLAVVDFEGRRYVAVTDGHTCLFVAVPSTLPLGDYRGVPYMVKEADDDWSKRIQKLLDTAKKQPVYPYRENDNVEKVAKVKLPPYGVGSSVLLASIDDGRFLVDMEKPHQVVYDRERYEFIFDAVGHFDTVRYSTPKDQLVFSGNWTNNFAILMPVNPGSELEKMYEV